MAGAIYVVACGGGGSTVAAVLNALEIVYDNSTSDLAATNVQAAIDEVEGRVDALEAADDFDALIVGEWTGSERTVYDVVDDITFTFNADGTYSCSSVMCGTTVGGFTCFKSGGVDVICDDPIGWEVINKTLRLSYNDPPAGVTLGVVLFPIHHLDSSNLELLDGHDDVGMRVITLAK